MNSPSLNTPPEGRIFKSPEGGRVLGFLQARIGSRRLRGKVLMPICGQSVLARAVHRLRAAATISDVVVLTTTLPEDDAVEKEAVRLGAALHRGPELDVLARFEQAAERFLPDIVVRATADNPLIDIGSVDRIVRALISDGLDYCMETGLPCGAATEALTAVALERAHNRALRADHREHVTLYIKEHPEEFRSAFLQAPEPVRHPELRFTVDTMDDYIYMCGLIGRLPQNGSVLSLDMAMASALSCLEGKRT